MIHTVKGFGIVNKAERDIFLELSYFFDDPADVGNLTSGSSSAFSKNRSNIWKFMVHVLLQPGLESFSFLSVIFVWFWYQGDGGLVEGVWKCSFLCSFLRILE